jgi:hypothetical protein
MADKVQGMRFQAIMGNLLQRMGLARLAGLQFGGARDMYTVLGYKSQLTLDDYIARYDRQDIAKRIVDAPAAATWSGQVQLEGKSTFNKAWKKLWKEKKLGSIFERVDKLAGLGQYSILVMGFDGTGQLSTPLPQGQNKKLMYLQPFSQKNALIKTFEQNQSNERFGLPTVYTIQAAEPNKQIASKAGETVAFASRPIDVHWTRVIHVAEGLMEDDIFGIPRLRPVYNLLDDLLKVVGGSAETYWLAGNRGVHANVDKEMDLSPEDEKNLSDEIEEYMHQLRRFIRTRGVKVESLGSDVADPQSPFRVIISLLSSVTGIPQRVLLGAEVGQLASEQDRANWADRVTERRTDFAEPYILRPFVSAMVDHGVLPNPGEYDVKWPNPYTMNPLEQAQLMAQKARAIVNISRQLDAGFPLVSLEEGREILLLGPEPAEGMGEIPEPLPMIDTQPGADGQQGDGQQADGQQGNGQQGNGQQGSRQ